MICPGCGREIPDEAQFCPYCGCQLKHEAAPTPVETTPAEHTGTLAVPRTDTDAKVRRRRVAIIACEVALAVALIVLLGASLLGRVTTAFGPSTHPVTFRAVLDDMGDTSSRVPARITGADVNGNEVDMEFYLARSGVDCELDPGTYHLEVLGSPIGSDGTIYTALVGSIDFEVPKNLKNGEEYVVPSSETLVFAPIEASEVTDEEIADAVEWARKDDDPAVDADALEKAARDRRDNPPVQLDTETLPMF